MKKTISIILAFALTMSVLFGLNISAYAAKSRLDMGNGITAEYDSSTKTLTISGEGSINGFQSSPFDSWNVLEYGSKIVIGEGITFIGANLFGSVDKFTSVEFADTVTGIGVSAFQNTRIPEFNLPKSVQSINDYAFGPASDANSTKVWTTAINVDSENPYFTSIDGVLYNKDVTRLIQVPSAYSGNNGEFTVPDTVVKIDKYAFLKCLNLTKVIIPESVEKIADYAFSLCKNVDEVVFDNHSKTLDISYSAFRYLLKIDGLPANYPLNNDTMLFKVYQNSSALIYAKNNEIAYEIFDPDEPLLNGWQEYGGKRYYYQDGMPLKGMQEIEGKKYIFSKAKGELLYGKIRCDGIWYISSKANGELLYGLVRCDGKRYIMSKTTGEMMYGKVRCNGKWYIMSKSSGIMLFGMIRCDGKYYITHYSTGQICYGMVSCSYKPFICSKADGHMFIDQKVTCDGKAYYCDLSGQAHEIK